MRYRITHSAMLECSYECPRCHTRGTTFVHGVGTSEFDTGAFSDAASERNAPAAADRAMRSDAQRTLSLIRCPRCNLRAPGALAWSAARFALAGALAIAGVVIGRSAWDAGESGLGGGIIVAGALLALVVCVVERRRLRAAERAREFLARSASALPKAVAHEKPARPPAPIVPVASVAPPRDPAPALDRPRFLRDDAKE